MNDDDKLSRFFDPSGILASPTWKLMNQLDEITKPIREFERQAKLFEDSHLATMKRAFEQLTGFTALDSLRAFNEAPFLKAAHEASESLRAFDEAFFLKAAREAQEGLSRQAKLFESAWATSVLAEQASAYTRLLDQMQPKITSEFLASLDRQLAGMVLPTASVLCMLGEHQVVLTKVDAVPEIFGAVSWVAPEADGPAIRAAGLRSRDAATKSDLNIEVAIRCALCGELMIAPRRGVEWDSNTKARIDVRVLPVCPKCIHEIEGSPEFWIEKLAELRRPTLKLIRGDGEDPGHADRDHLRIVEEPEDEGS